MLLSRRSIVATRHQKCCCLFFLCLVYCSQVTVVTDLVYPSSIWLLLPLRPLSTVALCYFRGSHSKKCTRPYTTWWEGNGDHVLPMLGSESWPTTLAPPHFLYGCECTMWMKRIFPFLYLFFHDFQKYISHFKFCKFIVQPQYDIVLGSNLLYGTTVGTL